ncbi:nucleoside deaminase [Demequina sp. NBRC 110057]|uniref:nucleoside deaminase n=1 Tax=Demequina sp. NBRC 110057 TaxID=1570346 RepID=UPI000A01C8E4|nr:nucleoside deaminase [Demequina sp. NBRC 110057]
MSEPELSAGELGHLARCVQLAGEALEAGHAPFGSVLVSGAGEVLAEDHNRTGDGDPTAHPEIALARWAAAHLTVDERAAATVFTSGEHCAMCAAAHAWVGLGRIVYATSTAQLLRWRAEDGVAPGPVQPLPIHTIAPRVTVEGPVAQFTAPMRALHARHSGR